MAVTTWPRRWPIAWHHPRPSPRERHHRPSGGLRVHPVVRALSAARPPARPPLRSHRRAPRRLLRQGAELLALARSGTGARGRGPERGGRAGLPRALRRRPRDRRGCDARGSARCAGTRPRTRRACARSATRPPCCSRSVISACSKRSGDEPAVAMVGARRASSYGLEMSYALGRGLGAAGVTGGKRAGAGHRRRRPSRLHRRGRPAPGRAGRRPRHPLSARPRPAP